MTYCLLIIIIAYYLLFIIIPCYSLLLIWLLIIFLYLLSFIIHYRFQGDPAVCKSTMAGHRRTPKDRPSVRPPVPTDQSGIFPIFRRQIPSACMVEYLNALFLPPTAHDTGPTSHIRPIRQRRPPPNVPRFEHPDAVVEARLRCKSGV